MAQTFLKSYANDCVHPEGQPGEVFSTSKRRVGSCGVRRGDITKNSTFWPFCGKCGALLGRFRCHMTVGSGGVVGVGGSHGEWGVWRAVGVGF